MGKLIAVLLLAGAGGWVYWHFYHQSPAYLAYVAFEDTLAEGNCDKLYAQVDEQAKEVVDDFCTPGGGMLTIGRAIPGRSAASLVAEMKGTAAGEMLETVHNRQSEEGAEDGSVTLVVVETPLHRNVMNMNAAEQHDVKLKKVGEAWKIVSYKIQPQK